MAHAAKTVETVAPADAVTNETDPNEYNIVRASARLRIQLSTGNDENSEAAKHLYRTLYETRRQIAAAANYLTQQLWLADAKALEASRRDDKKTTAGKPAITWTKYGASAGALNVYEIFRKAAPDLGSQVCATMQKKVVDSWIKKRFNVLVRMTEAVPFYHNDGSFPLRAQGFRLAHKQGNQYEVSFSVRPGRHPGGAEFRVLTTAHDEYQHELLHNLASEQWKIGEMLIEQDRRRKSVWYLRFTYTQRRKNADRVGKVAAINRGMAFLVGVTEDGTRWLYEGNGINAHLKQLKRRRQSYQRERLASNRYGHGRQRALLPIESLEDKGSRWRATKNQTIARRFVGWLVKQDVTILRMEDFTGIRDQAPDKLGKPLWDAIHEWPFYDLGSRIKSCCEEEGIMLEVHEAKDLSRRCCFCGHVAPENINTTRRRMVCARCKRTEHLDVNAAKNLLSFADVPR
jgi:transposase